MSKTTQRDDLATDYATLAREYAAVLEARAAEVQQVKQERDHAYVHIKHLQGIEERLREQLNDAFNGGAASVERAYTADAYRQLDIVRAERDAARAEAERAKQANNELKAMLRRDVFAWWAPQSDAEDFVYRRVRAALSARTGEGE